MLRRFGRASMGAALALAALGTFVIAGSQAQAAKIDSLSRGSISTGNGSYVGHQGVPAPTHNPVVHLPPGGQPHPGGIVKK